MKLYIISQTVAVEMTINCINLLKYSNIVHFTIKYNKIFSMLPSLVMSVCLWLAAYTIPFG